MGGGSVSKDVEWEGDSNDVIKSFPKGVKEDLGFSLHLLQEGEKPPNSRPMQSIAQGVFELKTEDKSGWYRVLYYTKIKNKIYVLHCFTKQSGKTDARDLGLASDRLKALTKRVRT